MWICIRDLQKEKRDHLYLPHSHPSEVEGIRIVVISFRNIAKNRKILSFWASNFSLFLLLIRHYWIQWGKKIEGTNNLKFLIFSQNWKTLKLTELMINFLSEEKKVLLKTAKKNFTVYIFSKLMFIHLERGLSLIFFTAFFDFLQQFVKGLSIFFLKCLLELKNPHISNSKWSITFARYR